MKVGICLITKNCYGPYLHDWLQYHTDLGVDMFYIYDNESKPSVIERMGLSLMDYNVQLLWAEGKGAQISVYNHCIESIKNNSAQHCDWIAFIDDDEYIVCENNDLKATLQKYDEHSAIAINWLIYGSSGLKTKTPISPRKKFIKHIHPSDDVNKHIKSIVKPSKVKQFVTPHSCILEEGTCCDVEYNHIYPGYAFTSKPIHHTIWLNHYWTKSEEEFIEKTTKGRADAIDPIHNHKIEFLRDTDSKCTYQTIKSI